MVVIDLPLVSLIVVTQDLRASPSIWMVQAPHAATPQPNFVPVRPSTSRRYQSTGIDGSPSNVCVWPLTFRVTMFPSLSKAAALKSVLPGLISSYGSSGNADRILRDN